MKNTIFLSLTLCMLGMPLFGQEIARQQFSSEGGSAQVGSYSMSYTVGEAFVGIGLVGKTTLVQGFQQGFVQNATSLHTADYQTSIRVFPNPSVKEVELVLSTAQPVGLHLILYTLDGKVVKSYPHPHRKSLHRVQLDISDLVSGMYQLLIYDHHNLFIQAYKLQKQ